MKEWLNAVMFMVILSSSIYMMIPDSIRIDVQNTKTIFKVWENDAWVIGAVEYLYLYDGAKKMRASKRWVTNETIGSTTRFIRHAIWKDNITTEHIYLFDHKVSDIEDIPLDSYLICNNCQGKIVHFEYRVDYDGETRSAISPESFEHRMKVEWDKGYAWAKVYQQKYAQDKLIIRYRPESSEEIYNVRMFDPIVELTLSLEGTNVSQHAELGSLISIVATTNNTGDTVCVDIDHPDYGINYSCSTDSLSFDFNITYFDSTEATENLVYSGHQNKTYNISVHEYDEPISLTLDLKGYESFDTFPTGVKIYIDGSLSNTVGLLIDPMNYNTDLINDSVTSKNVTFTELDASMQSGGYFRLPKEAVVNDAYLNLTGYKFDEVNEVATNMTYDSVARDDDSMTVTDAAHSYDGDWDTYAYYNNAGYYVQKEPWVKVNYTLQGYTTTSNVTTKFAVEGWHIVTAQITLSCYNGATWTTIDSFNWQTYVGTQTLEYEIPTACMDNGDDIVQLYYDMTLYSRQYPSRAYLYDTEIKYLDHRYPTEVALEVGLVDGHREWSQTDAHNTTNTTGNLSNALNDYLDACTADSDGYCEVPITLIATSGIEELSAIDIDYTYNTEDISINLPLIESELATLSGHDNLTLTIESKTSGIVEVSNVRYYYIGGNKTYTVSMSSTDPDGDCYIIGNYNNTVATGLIDEVYFNYTMVKQTMPGAIEYHITNWSNVAIIYCYDPIEEGWDSYVPGRPINDLDYIDIGWYCSIYTIDDSKPITLYSSYFNLPDNSAFQWTFLNDTMNDTLEYKMGNWSDLNLIECNNGTDWFSYDSTTGSNNLTYIERGWNCTIDTISNDTFDLYSTICTTVSHEVTYYYSRWDYDYPQYIDYMEFIPTKLYQTEVSAYGQTATKPILNITAQQYSNKNFTMSIMATGTDNCVKMYLGDNSSYADYDIDLNGSFQDFGYNFTDTTSKNYWMWVDLLYHGGYVDDTELVAHYKLDKDATDSHGSNDGSKYGNISGTINSSTWGTDCKYSNCLDFDGVDDYVDLGMTTFDTSNPYSISLWVKADSGENSGHEFISKCKSNYYYSEVSLRIMPDNKINLIVGNGATGYSTGMTSNSEYADGTYHHFTFVYDGTNYYMYKDSNPDGNVNVASTYSSDARFSIGRRGEVSYYFNGSIDSVRIWDKALSQSEIQAEMISSLPVETSGLIASMELDEGTGSTTYSVPYTSGQIGEAMWFDGVDDYIDCGDIDISDSITVSAWIKRAEINQFHRVLSKSGSYQYFPRIESNNRIMCRLFFDDGSNTGEKESDSARILDTAWHHIATSFSTDTGYIRIYIDGTEKVSWSGYIGKKLVTNNNNAYIGITEYFNGSMDDVRIYSVALNEDEIENIYLNGHDGCEDPDRYLIPDVHFRACCDGCVCDTEVS